MPEVVQAHAGQIDNVMSALEKGSPLLIDGINGRKTLEFITAIYKSASTGEKAILPLSEKDQFHTREGIMANATHFYEKTKSIDNFVQNSTITTVPPTNRNHELGDG